MAHLEPVSEHPRYMPPTMTASETLQELRKQYDHAFGRLAAATTLLQQEVSASGSSKTAEVRLRVERAERDYRETRNRLSEFLLHDGHLSS
jgi:hypothetical protein